MVVTGVSNPSAGIAPGRRSSPARAENVTTEHPFPQRGSALPRDFDTPLSESPPECGKIAPPATISLAITDTSDRKFMLPAGPHLAVPSPSEINEEEPRPEKRGTDGIQCAMHAPDR